MRIHASWHSGLGRALRASGLRRAVLFVFVLAALGIWQGLGAPAMRAAAPPQPTYGSAVVDGSASEWNLTNDFFADMYEASNPAKDVLSKLYLRYDCATGVLYVLVLAVSGVKIKVNTPAGEHYVKLQNNLLVSDTSGNNGTPPDFQFINTNGVLADGWEASANVATGSYTDLNVHTQVVITTNGSEQTSAVANREIPLTLICTDWGDLPTSAVGVNPGYSIVTSAQNGARHSIGTLYMGTYIDGEADGQPNSTATGDDTNNVPDDEDGVIADPSFVWTLAGGGKVRVTVTGPGAGIIGCVSGWMDFNNDGDFNDTGENIINKTGVTSGTTSILFSIPSGTTLPGTFFSRFRLYAAVSGSCTSVTSALTGAATNGEVEDHRITSVSSATASLLASFEGAPRKAFALLKWETATELGMLGANVWRSNKRGGTYVKVNVNVIRAKTPGTIGGNAYRFKDKSVTPGKKYFYKIELVGAAGGTLERSESIMVRIPSAQ